MKALVSVICLLVGAVAFAQEIGTEIPPETTAPQPPPPPPPTYDNPYGQPEAGTTGSGTSTPASAGSDGAAPSATARVPGPRQGAFGIRASFQGSSVPAVPATGTASATPTLGLKYMATDGIGLNFDVGFSLGIGSTTTVGFGVGLGVDAYLGGADKPIRPFVTGGVDFSKTFSRGDIFLLGINIGGGAEAWITDHLSLNGKLLVGVPLNLQNLDTLVISTFQPGVGATFYF